MVFSFEVSIDIHFSCYSTLSVMTEPYNIKKKKCIEMLFPWRTELWDPSVFEINSPCLYNFEIENKYRIVPCKWKMWGFMIFSDKSSQVLRELCQWFVERYVTCIITVICHQFFKSMFITHCRGHVFSGFQISFLL